MARSGDHPDARQPWKGTTYRAPENHGCGFRTASYCARPPAVSAPNSAGSYAYQDGLLNRFYLIRQKLTLMRFYLPFLKRGVPLEHEIPDPGMS